MRLLKKNFIEGEEEHWNTVLRVGAFGGAAGLAVGGLALAVAARRVAVVRSMTLQFRVFLLTSAGVFGAITSAERASLAYERSRSPAAGYVDAATRAAAASQGRESMLRRSVTWIDDNKLSITLVAWAASMAGALTLVSRDRYATTSQKVVQARVYAQGLTLAAILAVAALSWLAPDEDADNNPTKATRSRKHQQGGQDMWKDMVAAEELRLAQLEESRKQEAIQASKNKGNPRSPT